MAPMMLHPAADEHHKRLLAPLNLPTSAQEETRFFLHTQGLASTLGFRRAWPAPPRFAAQEPLTGILDERDERFAAMLHAQGLLLRESAQCPDSDEAKFQALLLTLILILTLY